MGLFGKSKKAQVEESSPAAEQPAEEVDTDPAQRASRGPLDEREWKADDVARLDLGCLRLPGKDGMQLRLEVDDKENKINAINVGLGQSSVQLQVYAAPRKEGIWDEIREELLSQIQKSGGTADDVPGEFGREILARIPSRTSDGRTGHQVARFIGIDGPRWFVRGVFSGVAAHDIDAAKELEEIIRGIVIVRGDEARPPRELLELRPPANARPVDPETGQPVASGTAPQGDSPADDAAGDTRPPERGPEIQQIG